MTTHTYLFYDKYAGYHNFTNKITKIVQIDDLINNNGYTHLIGPDALKYYDQEFKKTATQTIPKLDEQLYQLHIYHGVFCAVKHIYTVIAIDNRLIIEYVPNDNFWINIKFIFHVPNFPIFKRSISHNCFNM